MSSTTDRIEREVLLKAPRARVWRALSNAEEFGDWFGVALKGSGCRGRSPIPGTNTSSSTC
jgi:uncharacterized protein YndB with AHSA1/START domain